ncbi:MAG: cytochrome P450 [Proteobacteria bacterium]|nr:cytochrome P450 [Pseudomonadota bacterium]
MGSPRTRTSDGNHRETSSDDAAERPVASGTEISALNPEFRKWPHEILDDLRLREPVHRDRMFDRVVLTRAVDVEAVLNDRTLSSDPRKSRNGSFTRKLFNVDDEDYRPTMLHMDDPDHKRLRGLVTKAFSQRSIHALRPRVAAVTESLLKDIPVDRPFDLMELFARPLPTVVIAEILGADPARHNDFKNWSEGQILMFNPARSEEQEQKLRWAVTEMRAFFQGEVERRIQAGEHRDDLLGQLIAAEQDGEKLTERELVGTCLLILAAGNVTTTDLIGNGIYALLTHREQLDALRADPSLYPAAVEEILRYDSPVVQASRQTVSEREVGGCPMAKGQALTPILAAANHDPELHSDPHTFDIRRMNQRHFSFGGGAHFCLGAPLARLETQVALSMLLERFPRLRLMPDILPVRKATPSLNGFETLWVDPT